jgi:endonuclease/exonuclease/phosphatase (EEP) superfamily protein YafD
MAARTRVGLNALVAVYLAGLTAGLAVIGLGSAHNGWPALARELVPVLLLPTPVLIGLALILRARGAILGLLAPLALIVLLYGQGLVPRATPTADSAGFRILTFNVGGHQRLDRPAAIVDTVQAASPDVVCLVETSSTAMTTVGDRLHESHPFQASSDSVFVFSRFPLSDVRTNVLHAGTHDSMQVSIEIDHRLVDLTVVHLARVDQYSGLRRGLSLLRSARTFSTNVRDSAVEDLAALLRAEPGPRILVGDLNMTPTSHAHGVLSQELRDAFFEAGWGLGHTFPARPRAIGLDISLPLIRIDYIFHSDDLVARRAWVGPDGGSDHLPVVADLAFR